LRSRGVLAARVIVHYVCVVTYREILERFTDTFPGTRAIVFCDHEGEAIEFVSDLDSYHTQVFGAYQSELMLLMKSAVKRCAAGKFQSLFLDTTNGTVSLWPIGDSYYVAVMCKTALSGAHPAVTQIRRILEAEV
jgi:predicted regulator of Ras-like GTPase activity (Roadblock/LC7/MglB family)